MPGPCRACRPSVLDPAAAPGRIRAAYDAQARKLATMFRENFEQFAAQVSDAVAAEPARRSRVPSARCVALSLEIIRDPLWDNIRLDRPALLALDTPAVQRLRYVRQVGHAFLVYPGATHTRFEHALGAYHLTRRALASLEERGELDCVPSDDCLAVRLAALLHDIGHYPFSHALEEAGFPSHEALGVAKLAPGRAGRPARRDRRRRLRRTRSARSSAAGARSPLQGLISGSLDLDKIDYLSRDARMCGVPYGTVDVDRLLATLTLVETGTAGSRSGVQEKGVSALESLLFAKYQMYRNVYWHHAVRSATCMFKRAVRGAVARGQRDRRGHRRGHRRRADGAADHRRRQRAGRGHPRPGGCTSGRSTCRPATCPSETQPWVADDPDLLERVEDALAREVGLAAGRAAARLPGPLLDARRGPAAPHPGRLGRAADRRGSRGTARPPRVADELYRSARRLRVFVAGDAARRSTASPTC